MKDKQILIEGAQKLGIELTQGQLEQLQQYKDYTLEINKSLNLTSITEDKDFLIKHFLDSFTLNKIYDFTKAENMIDIGTGAGVPGIPMKILYPHIELTLVDSLKKKVHFLKDVIGKLKLKKVECVHARAEDLGQDLEYRESFDLVMSRAVAHLTVLSEYCIPFLKLNGTFLCLKGPKYKEEIEDSKVAIEKLGGRLERVQCVQLPFSEISHHILVIRKIKHTPAKFPRKAGKPTKNPIK